jgi:hypothetical protein
MIERGRDAMPGDDETTDDSVVADIRNFYKMNCGRVTCHSSTPIFSDSGPAEGAIYARQLVGL